MPRVGYGTEKRRTAEFNWWRLASCLLPGFAQGLARWSVTSDAFERSRPQLQADVAGSVSRLPVPRSRCQRRSEPLRRVGLVANHQLHHPLAMSPLQLSEDLAHQVARWSSRRTLYDLCLVSRATYAAAGRLLYRCVMPDVGDTLLATLRTRPDLAHHAKGIICTTDNASHLPAYLIALPNLVSVELYAPPEGALTSPTVADAFEGLQLQCLTITQVDAAELNPILSQLRPIKHLRLEQITYDSLEDVVSLSSLLLRSSETLESLALEWTPSFEEDESRNRHDVLTHILKANRSTVWPNVRDVEAMWTGQLLRAFPNVCRMPLALPNVFGAVELPEIPALEFMGITFHSQEQARIVPDGRSGSLQLYGLHILFIPDGDPQRGERCLSNQILSLFTSISTEQLYSLALHITFLGVEPLVRYALFVCSQLRFLGFELRAASLVSVRNSLRAIPDSPNCL